MTLSTVRIPLEVESMIGTIRRRVYSPCVGERFWTGIGLIRILAAYQTH